MTDLDAIDERWVFYGSLAHTATHLYVYMLSDLPTLRFCGNNKFLLFCYSIWITPCYKFRRKFCRNILAAAGNNGNFIIVVI